MLKVSYLHFSLIVDKKNSGNDLPSNATQNGQNCSTKSKDVQRFLFFSQEQYYFIVQPSKLTQKLWNHKLVAEKHSGKSVWSSKQI